jgi:MFS family permease
MTVVQTSYLNVVTLLPLYVKAHHNVFSFFEVGILVGAYQFSFSFAAPIAGENLSSVGRRRMILIAVGLMTGAILLFAAAAFFENHWVFYAISLIARFIQGGADAMLLISMFSIAMIEWSEEAELY